MKYDIFLFDADDTLYDFHKIGERSFYNVCRRLGVDFQNGDYETYSKINQRRWDLMSKGLMTKEEVIYGRFEEYASLKNVSFDVKKFRDEYEQGLCEICVEFPESREVLETLKKRGARVYLITNGTRKVQRSRLKKSSLTEFFDGIFISEVIGFNKPSDKYFSAVKNSIPFFDPKRTLVVGDSLVSDIPLANANGIDSCRFNPKEEPNPLGVPYDYEIKNLKELLDIVF